MRHLRLLAIVLLVAAALAPGSASRASHAQCSDEIDNDGDGLIDYPEDPGCGATYDNDETTAYSRTRIFISYVPRSSTYRGRVRSEVVQTYDTTACNERPVLLKEATKGKDPVVASTEIVDGKWRIEHRDEGSFYASVPQERFREGRGQHLICEDATSEHVEDGTVIPECRNVQATIFGSDASDRLTGTDDNDVIVAGKGDDLVMGRGGHDLMCGDGGSDRILGGRGSDHLRGGPGVDDLRGGPGGDEQRGSLGSDLLRGGPADDDLFGQRGDDHVFGGPGGDFIEDTYGADALYGARGEDRIQSGRGPDLIVAGRGTDHLDGGSGADDLRGGGGPDELFFDRHPAGVVVDLETQHAFDGWSDEDSVIGIEIVLGTSFDDTLLGDSGPNELIGDPYVWCSDVPIICGGADEISGGAGEDLIMGLPYCSDPGDELRDGLDALDGGEGDDVIYGTSLDECQQYEYGASISGGPGDDVLFGTELDDSIDGGEGDDSIDGGRRDDTINGGAGNDSIEGGEGNDSIDGGDGTDSCLNGETVVACE